MGIYKFRLIMAQSLKTFQYQVTPMWDNDQMTYVNASTISFHPSKFFVFGDPPLGSGTYGRVYQLREFIEDKSYYDTVLLIGPRLNIILKWIKLTGDKVPNLVQECAIQQKLFQKEPGVCPNLYEYGKVIIVDETGRPAYRYIVVMEMCVGTARSLLHRQNRLIPKDNPVIDYLVLDYLEQMAKILKRLEKYNFNHRDLKSDNIMFKRVAVDSEHPFGYKFLLIDFGFSCATFDGTQYEGTLYFKPGAKCFRKSRDIASLVFELLSLNITDTMKRFGKLLLTFDFNGKPCDMTTGCLPDFDGKWLSTYNFLDKDDVENPNTTPNGLLAAIRAFREKGIEKCEQEGFIKDPVKDACVPDPGVDVGALAAAGAGPPMGPVEHIASPAVVAPQEGVGTPIPPPVRGGKRRRKTARRKKMKRRKTKKCY